MNIFGETRIFGWCLEESLTYFEQGSQLVPFPCQKLLGLRMDGDRDGKYNWETMVASTKVISSEAGEKWIRLRDIWKVKTKDLVNFECENEEKGREDT